MIQGDTVQSMLQDGADVGLLKMRFCWSGVSFITARTECAASSWCVVQRDDVIDAEELGEWEWSSEEEDKEKEALLLHDTAQSFQARQARQNFTDTWF
eukprot:g35442.t1